jgi:transcriptional regulator with XRE-family HTH domain
VILRVRAAAFWPVGFRPVSPAAGSGPILGLLRASGGEHKGRAHHRQQGEETLLTLRIVYYYTKRGGIRVNDERGTNNPESRVAIGQRLKEATQRKGMRVADLATRLKVTEQAIYAWWKGRNQPELEMLAEYAGLLGVSLSWIVKGQDEATVHLLRWARLVAGGVTGDHAAREAIPASGLSPADLALVREFAGEMLDMIRQRLGTGWEARPDTDLLPVLQVLVEELKRE